ncbi:MAG TPA: hypothetical protein VFI47_15345 [Acidimicrobiales bacterium]|nr:hypothetical protein [Acidimicrobiales bacterium]
MSDDQDLRSRLERLASSAGDPPEHGLDRVTALRHRRLRRRRGAVATAAVLAVAGVTAALIGRNLDDGPSVTASETAHPGAASVEVPRIVEVRCEPSGIVVPVASVRPQRDGLHMLVVNDLGSPTTVVVSSPDWASGPITVPTGVTEVTRPVPPGSLTIGCDIAGRRERRQVDLVDPAGYYQEPELDCDEADRTVLTDLEVAPATMYLGTAVRQGLDGRILESDTIDAVHGYPVQQMSEPGDDPVAEVARDGDVIAFAHVQGPGGSFVAPWTTLWKVEACASALTPVGGAPPATSSTTVPQAGGQPPP